MVTRTIRVRSWLPVVLVAAVFLLQVFSPARAILFVFIALASVLFISWLWARALARGVSVQRLRRYGWAQVGDVLQERWIMHNDALVPLLWAEVREHSDLVGFDSTRAVGMPARASHQWTTQGVCRTRGVFTLGPLVVTMGDPFGLFEVELYDKHTETFVVYPAVVPLPGLLEERGLDRGAGRAAARSLAFTTNASSIRPYVHGDALKQIHWRSSARLSMPGAENLQVKLFDREPAGDLMLVLDMDRSAHVGHGEDSTEEYAVTLAASLAAQRLQENRAVGLITHTDAPVVIAPRKGQEQLWAVLRALAPIYATSAISLQQLLAMALPLMRQSTQVAIITPSADPTWFEGLGMLLTRGHVPTVLLMESMGPRQGAALLGVQGALADLGVPSHLIGSSFGLRGPSTQPPEPEFKVLGTGRAVRVAPTPAGDWAPVGPSGEQP
ncbi:MAG: DUF58 domain-containing protein [Anaerolineae bacterium]|jgi:uncharacterized protein (DUF58 family)|nr:DUF58 domain-containing protein [Chloroflexota bacterium]